MSEILARTPTRENADEISWARRILAAILLGRNNFQARLEALKLFDSEDRGGADRGPGEDLPLKAEDLQTLARVYAAQGTPAYRKQAIATLEKLMPTGLANPDDRYLLAGLYDDDGNWAKAREQYQAMTNQIGPRRGSDMPDRYVRYFATFAAQLLKHVQPAADQGELAEARELVDRVKLLRPESLDLPSLEARVCKANNEISKAVELIESGADRPQLPPGELLKLAALAEEFGQPELAERLLRKLASQQDRFEYRLPLVQFLARTGRVEAALDLCEQLWKEMPNPDALVPSLLDVVLSDKSKNGPARARPGCRVAAAGPRAAAQVFHPHAWPGEPPRAPGKIPGGRGTVSSGY